MRELTDTEIEQIEGGANLTTWAFRAFQVGGAYYTGRAIGEQINEFNAKHTMPLGEAIYRTFN